MLITRRSAGLCTAGTAEGSETWRTSRCRPSRCAALTFRRPRGLEALLTSLAKLDNPGPGYGVKVIIVDNDPDGSARSIVETCRTTMPWELVYTVEPRRGIPFGRNTAVRTAGDADFVAFLDDDEVAEPDWLTELLRVQRRIWRGRRDRNGSAGVRGDSAGMGGRGSLLRTAAVRRRPMDLLRPDEQRVDRRARVPARRPRAVQRGDGTERRGRHSLLHAGVAAGSLDRVGRQCSRPRLGSGVPDRRTVADQARVPAGQHPQPLSPRPARQPVAARPPRRQGALSHRQGLPRDSDRRVPRQIRNRAQG